MKDDYDKRVQERKDKVNKDRETIKRVNDKVVDIYHEIVDKYGPVDKWPPEVIDKFPGGKEVADLIAELERNKEKFGPHAVQPPRTKPPKDFWKKFLKGDWDYGWELEKKWLIGKAIGATNPKIDTKNKP
ncbi:uncharacterized protein LOC113234552 [Hyposmocoma kahamanoa]|uniref:uncharacterized protein LOC113234552 n=1 Tax=Hyposmocoma kahamanoa TaxID=1477025 RepID=UPI000E6D72D2|nr:uncharacterized protein LOC113234552 [Hyposmocoma kahamanoa]